MTGKLKKLKMLHIILLLLLPVLLLGCTPHQQQAVFPDSPPSFDVVVWGSTTSAVAAALEASAEGAHVLLLPQDLPLLYDLDILWKEGLLLANQEELPAEATEEDDLEENFIYPSLQEFILEKGGGLNDPHLVEAFKEGLPRLSAWLEEWENVALQQVNENHPLFPHLYLPAAGPAGKEALRKEILAFLNDSPVFLEREAKFQEIKLSSENEISSLLIDTENEEKEIFTRSLVIAGGGFSGSSTLLQQYAPQPSTHYPLGKTQGESLALIEKLGVGPVQAGFLHYHLFQEGFPQNNFHPGLLPPDGLFLVDKSYPVSFHDYWKDDMSARIYDRGEDLLYLFPLPEEDPFSGEEPFLVKQGLIEPGIVPSLEDLQEKGLAPLLVQEIAGTVSPPYGVISLEAGVIYTLGGLPVNQDGQLRRGQGVIRGLFAAGEAAGGFHGQAALQGSLFSESIVFGLKAGREAASWSRK